MSANNKMEEKPGSEGQSHAESSGTNALFSAVDGVTNQLQTIETFIARRFDELSMEINATAQQADMAEESITQRFAEILEILKAVSYSGDGSTAANAGVELDAVVDMTEEAAEKILNAAERITSRVKSGAEVKDDEARQIIMDGINKDVEEIFMACAFQDITGQRIRKTLENLQTIEDRLGNALDKMGIQVEVKAEDHKDVSNKPVSQDEIDGMF